MPEPPKSGSSEIPSFQSAPVPEGVQETPRRDYISREQGEGMFRFEHLSFLISYFLFYLPAVGPKPLDGTMRFADEKGAAI